MNNKEKKRQRQLARKIEKQAKAIAYTAKVADGNIRIENAKLAKMEGQIIQPICSLQRTLQEPPALHTLRKDLATIQNMQVDNTNLDKAHSLCCRIVRRGIQFEADGFNISENEKIGRVLLLKY